LIVPREINAYEQALASSGADLRPLLGLRRLLALDAASVTPLATVAEIAPSSTFGNLRALADKVCPR